MRAPGNVGDGTGTGFVAGPDPARVILRPFMPASGRASETGRTRADSIIDRVLALDSPVAAATLAEVMETFGSRHRNLMETVAARAASVGASSLPAPYQHLVGAYFLMEYSFESAALFNPSMVPHPDQSGTPPGSLRFILSLRAVGEGHVSSLAFRTGTIDAGGQVSLDPAARLASLADECRCTSQDGLDVVELVFSPVHDLSERIIFPATEAQARGIEDARFVRFDDERGARYFATYTAYSNQGIRSELIETSDFTSFRMTSLRGTATGNKGMALFPRKIGGRYAMISREDAENICFVTSDTIETWNGGVAILRPGSAWDLVQLGNCGSPIELPAGWLLFIHGVGPMRSYALGAVLLDKDDPTRVIARSREPLLRPAPGEREGYVPNVVYSCGGLRHGDAIVLPYAVSDTFTKVITLPIDALLQTLEPV